MAVSVGSITSADSTLHLSFPDIFSTPQQIFQFGIDDAYDSENVENAEVVKGVDGYMAMGWLPTLPRLNITLMANSPSTDFFNQIFQYEQQNRLKAIGSGNISVPGISTKYAILSCVLFGFMHIAPAKKTLQPIKYTLVCDDISYAPF